MRVHRTKSFVGIAVFASFATLAVTLTVAQPGCSEPSPSTGTGSGGAAAGTGGSTGTGTGGSTGTGTGGSTGAGTGGSTGAGGSTGPNPDANCTNSLAKTGVACTQNCVLVGQAGLNSAGTRSCTCTGGMYSACAVTPPANWGGALLAPCCTAPSTVAARKGTPCTTLWAECIASDAMSGTTYQGCACMDTGGVLSWECGSTNKWFNLAVAMNGGATACPAL